MNHERTAPNYLKMTKSERLEQQLEDAEAEKQGLVDRNGVLEEALKEARTAYLEIGTAYQGERERAAALRWRLAGSVALNVALIVALAAALLL